MSKAKHTPGPWIISRGHDDYICQPLPREKGEERDYDLPNYDKQVCMMYRCPEMYANGKLIVTAPEMMALLEITKSYLEEIECIHKQIKKTGVITKEGVMLNSAGLINAIVAIIDKAKGENHGQIHD